MNQIYVLTQSDGYSITKLGQSIHKKDMQTLMESTYQSLYPYNNLPENEAHTWSDFKDMSYLSDNNAILYDRGENVYVWQIIKVDDVDTKSAMPDINDFHTIAPPKTEKGCIPIDITIAPERRI